MKKYQNIYNFLFHTIKGRLVTNVILIHALMMGFVVFDLTTRQKEFMTKQVSDKGRELAGILAKNSSHPLLSNDLVALDEMISELEGVKDKYMIFITDRNGRVKATTHKEYFNMNLTDSISKALMSKLEDKNIDEHQIFHGNLVDSVKKIVLNDILVGYARVILNEEILQNELHSVINKGLIYTLFAIFVGALLAWLSIRTTTRDLTILKESAERISKKELDIEIPKIGGKTEISSVARAFEIMRQSVISYINELEKNTKILYSEKKMAEITLSSIGEGVIITDENGIITSANKMSEEFMGFQWNHAKNEKFESFIQFVDEKTGIELNILNDALDKKIIISDLEHILLKRVKDGLLIPVTINCAPIVDSDMNLFGCVVVIKNISQFYEKQKQIKYQAHHDALTGLYNRYQFERLLMEFITFAKEKYEISSLLFVDLDKFKAVNDTSGHIAGDEVLREVANLIQKRIRKGDYLCRFGGDEFGILLSNCPSSRAKNIAEDIIKDIVDFEFRWQDKVHKIGASVGIVEIDENTQSALDTLKKADSACYEAKNRGRNQAVLA